MAVRLAMQGGKTRGEEKHKKMGEEGMEEGKGGGGEGENGTRGDR